LPGTGGVTKFGDGIAKIPSPLGAIGSASQLMAALRPLSLARPFKAGLNSFIDHLSMVICHLSVVSSCPVQS